MTVSDVRDCLAWLGRSAEGFLWLAARADANGDLASAAGFYAEAELRSSFAFVLARGL